MDAWIGSLDLEKLGFSKTGAQRMGRPPYDPADLLLQRTRETIMEEINQYLSRLDSVDQNEDGEDANRNAVQAALMRLQQRQGELNDEIERLENIRSTLSIQGEPEARAMKALDSAPRYNLQAAVDAHSHLIVHHAVCNDTSDIGQLAPMAQGAAHALEAAPAVVADAGYANSQHCNALAPDRDSLDASTTLMQLTPMHVASRRIPR